MSTWTNISGSVGLCMSPDGGAKRSRYPFPKEQFSITNATPEPKDGSTGRMEFGLIVRSLPRARPAVEAMMSKFPQGETGLAYTLWDDGHCPTFFKYAFSDSVQKREWNALVGKYLAGRVPGTAPSWYVKSFAKLKDVEYVLNFTLSMSSGLRDCDAEEMAEAVERLILELHDSDIGLRQGCVVWSDGESRYALVTDLGEAKISKLDPETGAVSSWKAFAAKYSKEGAPSLVESESPNWEGPKDLKNAPNKVIDRDCCPWYNGLDWR